MSKLFFIALACLAAVAAADSTNTTLIQYGLYSDSACTTPTVQYNFTAGACTGGLMALFTDGSYVYTYLYSSGSACATANITEAVKVQANLCGARDSYGNGFTMYKAYSNVVNPAIPTGAFPPAGFATTTQYINTTGGSGDNTCSSAVQVIFAVPPQTTSTCYKTNNNMNSRQYFLDGTCTTSVTGYYSDPTCTNLVRTYSKSVTFKACDNGVKNVCSGSDASLPSIDSAVALTQYDNNQCVYNSKAYVNAAVPGGCYAGSTVACTTQNSTQFLTVVQYANNNCTGAVTETTYIGVDTCLTSGPVVNATATCNAGPGPAPSSSSSTGSVSVSSSTGTSGGNGTSSTGPADGSSGSNSADLTRSVSIGSMIMMMIVGFITIKMNN